MADMVACHACAAVEMELKVHRDRNADKQILPGHRAYPKERPPRR